MKNRLLLFLTCLLFTLPSVGQNRYEDEIFTPEQIVVDEDLTYGQNYSVLTGTPLLSTLMFDLYYPSSDVDLCDNDRPLAIYLHTGNFLPRCLNGSPVGSRDDLTAVAICTQLAQRGFVVASIDYRLGWNPITPDAEVRRETLLQAVYRGILDVKMAARYFRKTVAEDGNPFGIDAEKIMLVGEGTGGYLSLNAPALDDYTQLLIPKFLNANTGEPFVDTLILGNLDGSGGSLNNELYLSYSSDVSMAVNLGGALADTVWLDADDVPIVAFHCVNDPFAPYLDGTVIVPTTNGTVVDVFGSGIFTVTANEKGLNDEYLALNDPLTLEARSRYDQTVDYYKAARPTVSTNGDEGLYPFYFAPNTANEFSNQASPWQYWEIPNPPSSCSDTQGNPVCPDCLDSNPDMSETKALTYIDTILSYLMPRSILSLDLTAQPASECVGINDVKNSFAIGIYPNPAEHFLILTAQNDQLIDMVELMDMKGAVILSKDVADNTRFVLNRGNLSAGTYIVRLTDTKGNVSSRQVVFK